MVTLYLIANRPLERYMRSISFNPFHETCMLGHADSNLQTRRLGLREVFDLFGDGPLQCQRQNFNPVLPGFSAHTPLPRPHAALGFISEKAPPLICVSVPEELGMGLCPVISNHLPLMTMHRESSDMQQ